MAEPTEWILIAAAAVEVVQSLSGAKAAEDEANAESKIAKSNAEAVTAQAGQAEYAKRKSNREFLARQRAAIGEAGIGRGGTSEKVQEQSAIAAELDALNIRYEGMLQRTNWLNASKTAKARGKSARMAGYLGAAGGILSGAAGAFGAGGPAPTGGTASGLSPLTITAKRIPTAAGSTMGPYA